MTIRKTVWLHRLCFALGAFAALPSWACTDASGMTSTVATPGLGLTLTTAVDKSSAQPGDILAYALGFCNAGDTAITDLKIDNHTPTDTDFVSASCGTLPADMTCIVSAQPAPGAGGMIEWTLNGTLPPGASGSVNFQVSVR